MFYAASSSVSDNVSFVAVQTSMYKSTEGLPEAVACRNETGRYFFVVLSKQMAARSCLRQMNSCSY